jgi:formylglycine-generating enzyme required for sulfatase activity
MQQANVNGVKSRRSARRGKSREKSTGVGSFPPNAFGLFDMHGNVWEWCLDNYGEFAAEPEVDPILQNDSEQYVLRGGSWWNEAERARSAARHSLSATATGSAVGLRLCLSADE